MDVKRDLFSEMKEDHVTVALLESRQIAHIFYNALCNTDWHLRVPIDAEEAIIHRLKGIEPVISIYSWRRAGAIIAGIRNQHYNTTEYYMDFYSTGGEGLVEPLVEKCFNRLGWVSSPGK